MTGTWRIVALGALVLLLLATAYNGIIEGFNALHAVATVGHRIATATQLAYGVLAVAALSALTLKHPMTFRLLLAWSAMVVTTAALAPVVYGGTSVVVGTIAGLGVAAIVGTAIMAWRRSTRPVPNRERPNER